MARVSEEQVVDLVVIGAGESVTITIRVSFPG